MKNETRGRKPIGDKPADSIIKIRLERARKGRYVRAARQARSEDYPHGMSLSQWVLEACDAELRRNHRGIT